MTSLDLAWLIGCCALPPVTVAAFRLCEKLAYRLWRNARRLYRKAYRAYRDRLTDHQLRVGMRLLQRAGRLR